MTGAGLTAVPDPSGLFLADCRWGVPGAGVVAAMDGRRPLLVEVQALASQSGGGPGRRAAIGLDNARVSMVAAVMATQAHLSLVGHDIWAAVAGGSASPNRRRTWASRWRWPRRSSSGAPERSRLRGRGQVGGRAAPGRSPRPSPG
ncbi:MAG: hypothetical protein R2699_08080 [Acidimicrobiales bacterium]